MEMDEKFPVHPLSKKSTNSQVNRTFWTATHQMVPVANRLNRHFLAFYWIF
jgi:hypothetical protein